jgi:DNA-binding MarR family transcriptional regulator
MAHQPSNFAEQLRGDGIHRFGGLMLKAYRIFSEYSALKLSQRGHDGLGVVHIPIFALLSEEGTRIVTLAERTGTTKQYMGRMVQELEAKGYLRMQPDPKDKRAVLVSATERGLQFMRDAYDAKLEVEIDYVTYLGEERMNTFVGILEDLVNYRPNQVGGAVVEETSRDKF